MKNEALVHTVALLTSAVVALGMGTAIGSPDVSVLTEIFLGAMLYFVFVCIEPGDLKRSFSDRRFAFLTLAVNFIWTPLFAIGLGALFFGGDTDIRIGLFLALAAPCTDWYLVFTASAKGNVTAASSVLPMNLLLQIVLVPFFLLVFFGSDMCSDTLGPIAQTIAVLFVPMFLALTVRRFSGHIRERSAKNSSAGQLVFLCAAVFCMFLSGSQDILDNTDVLLRCVVPLVTFFAVNLLTVTVLSKECHMDRSDSVAAVFTCLARNSPLVLAMMSPLFQDSPLVLAVLAVTPLVELPILSLLSAIYGRKNDSS